VLERWLERVRRAREAHSVARDKPRRRAASGSRRQWSVPRPANTSHSAAHSLSTRHPAATTPRGPTPSRSFRRHLRPILLHGQGRTGRRDHTQVRATCGSRRLPSSWSPAWREHLRSTQRSMSFSRTCLDRSKGAVLGVCVRSRAMGDSR
jgi:hypothetical protein